MSDSEWYILVDEDIEPRVVEFLEKEGIRADHVTDALFQGADDEDSPGLHSPGRGAMVAATSVTAITIDYVLF